MKSIYFIDRTDGLKKKEEVFGESSLHLLYGNTILSYILGRFILFFFGKRVWFSRLYGWLQKRPRSARKIFPFIAHFGLDTAEFVKKPTEFSSFNDFFIRKLKPECRPIFPANLLAVMPADGRYRFHQKIMYNDVFEIKNQPFCLPKFLQDEALAKSYDGGSAVFARLCPIDCHRFYFPVDAFASPSRFIEGKLYSVNPLATQKNPWIWHENRRYLSLLSSPHFGQVAMVEVGATFVGSVMQTYTPEAFCSKGSEKGYFSFGGSAIVLLFEPGRIQFDEKLLALFREGLEIRCLIGQALGLAC
jgi:phosphatidylserine decarboxylase